MGLAAEEPRLLRIRPLFGSPRRASACRDAVRTCFTDESPSPCALSKAIVFRELKTQKILPGRAYEDAEHVTSVSTATKVDEGQ